MVFPSYKNAVAVTPNDVTKLAKASAVIYTAGAGTLSVLTAKGQTVSITAVAGGCIPISVQRVNAAGTSATGIVSLW
jgi:hypothetical protein